MSKGLETGTMLPIGSLEAYRHSVEAFALLSREEERELATRFRSDHDLDAAWQLVMSHLRFVVRIARGYNGYGLAQADLIQEGNIGLMKAVKRFDPAVGVRLVSFAVHWIRAEIHEFILRNWRIVKVATTKAQRKLFFNLRSSRKRLGWLDRDEVDAVANDLGVSAADVLEMEQRLNAHDLPYDAPASEEAEAVTPASFLPDVRYEPSAEAEDDEWGEYRAERLNGAIAALDERSQDIVRARWLGETKMTLQALADVHGVSAERIRQLESSALKKLRRSLAAPAV